MLHVCFGFTFEEATQQSYLGTLVIVALLLSDHCFQGRLYDGHILDMVEFGVDEKVSIEDIEGAKKGIGSKPMMVFVGDQWENDSLFKKIQNILLDFFKGDKADKISMKGVDHLLACSVVDSKIYVRGYVLTYSKSNSRVPDLSLNPMGPFLDLSVRRHQMASDDMWKIACKKSKRFVFAFFF